MADRVDQVVNERSGPAPARPGGRRREKPQQIADQLRQRIIAGEFEEGEQLGSEQELIEHFGVSRPSLREALRILEAEGLISVLRGALGGVVAHRPDQRQAARSTALVLQARNVPLADVFEARTIIEPAAVRIVASSRGRKRAAKVLRALIAEQELVLDDPEELGKVNARFHETLVGMAGNQTMVILYETVNEVVARAVTAMSQDRHGDELAETRRRGIRSQQRLAALIERGEADRAEQHWATHMAVVGRMMLGRKARTVIDLMDHM